MPLPADKLPFYLAALVESSDDAIVSKDLDGIITSWNRGAERIFGYSADEVIGRSIRIIIPSDRQAEEDFVLSQIRRGERLEHFDTVRQRKDGTFIPISLTVSPIRDDTGRIIGISKVARDIGDRLRFEREIARSHAFAERIADTSPDLLFVYHRPDDRLVYANDGIAAILGRPLATDRKVDVQLAELVPPEDRSILTEAFDRLDAAGHGVVVEYAHRVRRADGDIRHVSVRATIFERGADGRAEQIVGHAVDVTDARAAEQRNQDLRRRLDLLVRASGAVLRSPELRDVLPATMQTARELVAADGYALWRLSPRSGEWHALASFGVSEDFVREAVLGPGGVPMMSVPFTDPVVIDDVGQMPLVAHRLEAYRREGIKGMLIVPLMMDGEATGTLVFYYHGRCAPTEVELHVAAGLGNLAASAIRSAEMYAELKRSEQEAAFLDRASAVLGSSLEYAQTLTRIAELAVPDIADWCAVDIVDDEGKPRRLAVTHVEPRKLELLRTLEARFPSDASSQYGVHQVLRTHAPVMMERIPDALLAAGARSPEHLAAVRELGLMSYICVPLLARGACLGVLTLATAESGRSYTARDLEFAEELARRAAMAIENAHAYENASRANRLKDDFLATLSHELRTPLNAVVGYVRMIRSGALGSDRQVRALEVVERNAASLTQMVEDVLDVSRIVAGKIRLNVQPVEVAQVLRSAIATVTPAADARGVSVQMLADPFVPPVAADPERLQQVVWNLLSNSVKFTPRGGHVQLRLEQVESSVEIVVSDTGVGIRPEFVPHVFERFRQADSRFSREFGGLGLGLAICRHLVEMHGGTIHAASGGVGQGSTFRVRLPVLAAHAGTDADERVLSMPGAPAAPLPLENSRLTGLRVLAVDDDADSLALVREILEAGGAAVTTAASATEALAAISRQPPDVLLTDIGMPHADGFALIAEVRRSPAADVRSMPAAALTAYARAQDRTRALESGFEMHLAKPVDPVELLAAVRALASRRQLPPA